MAFTLPAGLAPEAYPLAWLLGRWHGSGMLAYPGIDAHRFGQTIRFDHDGGPYLSYTSTIRLLSGDAPEQTAGTEPTGAGPVGAGPVWQTESGFWRVTPTVAASPEGTSSELEVLLADPSGHLSLYLGTVGNGRVDLSTDLVARTSTAADVTAATRLYGLVEGDLMWAWDLAAFGHPMQPYASARLARQEQG